MAEDVIELANEEVESSARQLHQSGEAVAKVASTLSSAGFSSGCSGRIYSQQGSAVQTGTQILAQVISKWSEADDAAGNAILQAVSTLVRTDSGNRSDVSGVS